MQLSFYSVHFRHIGALKPDKYFIQCHATEAMFIQNLNAQGCDRFHAKKQVLSKNGESDPLKLYRCLPS